MVLLLSSAVVSSFGQLFYLCSGVGIGTVGINKKLVPNSIELARFEAVKVEP